MLPQHRDDNDAFEDSFIWGKVDDSRETTSCWVFSKLHTNSGTRIVRLDGLEYKIHEAAVDLMSFFEVYCDANRSCQLTTFNKNLCGYLNHRRRHVCAEVKSTPSHTLIDPTWHPRTLTKWAIRVGHGFNHSPNACRMYYEYCAKKGLQPYKHDDPLEYGRFY